MKRLSIFSASLFVVSLFSGCASQPGAMTPNMMPAMPPPPPCCCNNTGGAQQQHPPSGMPNPEMRGDGASPRANRPFGEDNHPPHPGMGRFHVPEPALKACDGKKEKETCTFSDRGWTMTGICALPRHPMPPGNSAEFRGNEQRGRIPDDKEKKDGSLVCSPDSPKNTETPPANRKK